MRLGSLRAGFLGRFPGGFVCRMLGGRRAAAGTLTQNVLQHLLQMRGANSRAHFHHPNGVVRGRRLVQVHNHLAHVIEEEGRGRNDQCIRRIVDADGKQSLELRLLLFGLVRVVVAEDERPPVLLRALISRGQGLVVGAEQVAVARLSQCRQPRRLWSTAGERLRSCGPFASPAAGVDRKSLIRSSMVLNCPASAPATRMLLVSKSGMNLTLGRFDSRCSLSPDSSSSEPISM